MSLWKISNLYKAIACVKICVCFCLLVLLLLGVCGFNYVLHSMLQLSMVLILLWVALMYLCFNRTTLLVFIMRIQLEPLMQNSALLIKAMLAGISSYSICTQRTKKRPKSGNSCKKKSISEVFSPQHINIVLFITIYSLFGKYLINIFLLMIFRSLFLCACLTLSCMFARGSVVTQYQTNTSIYPVCANVTWTAGWYFNSVCV